jgi:hypothetical protein
MIFGKLYDYFVKKEIPLLLQGGQWGAPNISKWYENYKRFMIFHTIFLPILITIILIPSYVHFLLFSILVLSRQYILSYLYIPTIRRIYQLITIVMLMYVFFSKSLYWLFIQGVFTWGVFVSIHISTRRWENAGV